MGRMPPCPQIPVAGSSGVQESPKLQAKLNPLGIVMSCAWAWVRQAAPLKSTQCLQGQHEGCEKQPPPLPFPSHATFKHACTRVNKHACKYAHVQICICLNMRARPEELGHLTVLFLATILSSFLAIRTSSSAGPMAGAPAEQGAGGGHRWALLTWGPWAAGWEGAERRGKGGKGREGTRREGREAERRWGCPGQL